MIECKLYRLPKTDIQNWLIFVTEGKIIISYSDSEALDIPPTINKGFIDGNNFICCDKNNNRQTFRGIERKEHHVPNKVKRKLKNVIKMLKQ